MKRTHGSTWRMIVLGVLAGCDAGPACAGCEFPTFTVSGGDTSPQLTAATVVVRAVPAPPDIDAAAPSTGVSPNTPDAYQPGYSVIRRDYGSSAAAAPTSEASGAGMSVQSSSAPVAAETSSPPAPDSADAMPEPTSPEVSAPPPPGGETVVIPYDTTNPQVYDTRPVAPRPPLNGGTTYPVPAMPTTGGVFYPPAHYVTVPPR
jgi:hypothetical protein